MRSSAFPESSAELVLKQATAFGELLDAGGAITAHRTSMSLPPGLRDWLSLAASWIWSSV
jgi:hypothetical protein